MPMELNFFMVYNTLAQINTDRQSLLKWYLIYPHTLMVKFLSLLESDFLSWIIHDMALEIQLSILFCS